MPRQKNKRPLSVAITPSTDGRWHGFLAVGEKDRKHFTAVMCAKCKAGNPDRSCECARRCEAKVRTAEDVLAKGETPSAAGDPWAEQYFTAWLEDRRDEIEYGTMRSYSTVVRLYLVPNVKGQRLRRFNSNAAIKALLRTVKETVSAQAARKTLRVLRKALNDAVRDKFITRNEATFVAMPTLEKVVRVKPLSLAEARAVLPVIMRRRLRARWLFGLMHGPRQGECLGLMWYREDDPRCPPDINLDTGEYTIMEKLQRRTWEHGCGDPHSCGISLHKTKPCPQPCRRHTRACPPPCAKDCDGHASACPDRKGGGLVRGQTKGKKDRNGALDPMLWQMFREWKAQQDAERDRVGNLWVDSGHVFTDEFGKPISPERDYREFQAILSEAGLPPARVHALRHTTATFLLAAGVQKRIVMEILGWSQDMTSIYQTPTDEMKRDAGNAIGALLWPVALPDPNGDDSATAVLPPERSNVIQFRPKAV